MLGSKPKPCKQCGSIWHTAWYHKPKKPLQARKRMKAKGQKTIAYEQWRDEIAKPFLDESFGHICIVPGCWETEGLQVDHILNRSTHPRLKMNLENIQYLCEPHHELKTFKFKEYERLL